jgi:hypothetical protein
MTTTTKSPAIAALMSNDAAFAAANRAALPGILASLAAELAPRRAAFLEEIVAAEAAAKARKSLTDDELEAALRRKTQSHVYFGGKDDEGVLVVAGASLRCSYFHPTVCDRSGRREFVFLPLADAALQEMRAAADALIATPEEVQRHHVARSALWNAQQGRRANASRQRNAAERASLAVAEGTYAVGEGVEVHAMGRWYKGEVVKLGRTGKVTVRYTSGTGTTRDKAVASDKVRKTARKAS